MSNFDNIIHYNKTEHCLFLCHFYNSNTQRRILDFFEGGGGGGIAFSKKKFEDFEDLLFCPNFGKIFWAAGKLKKTVKTGNFRHFLENFD